MFNADNLCHHSHSQSLKIKKRTPKTVTQTLLNLNSNLTQTRLDDRHPTKTRLTLNDAVISFMVYIIRDFSFGLSSYWILLNDFRWLVIKSSFGLVR